MADQHSGSQEHSGGSHSGSQQHSGGTRGTSESGGRPSMGESTGQFRCPKCNQNFSNAEELRHHEQQHHQGSGSDEKRH